MEHQSLTLAEAEIIKLLDEIRQRHLLLPCLHHLEQEQVTAALDIVRRSICARPVIHGPNREPAPRRSNEN